MRSNRDSVATYTAMPAKSKVVSVSHEDPEPDKRRAFDKIGTISSAVTLSAAMEPSSKVNEKVAAKNNKSDQIQGNCCTYLKQTATLVWIERIFLISICTAVAGAFAVPIIIYALDTDRGDNSTISIDLNVDNCSTLDVQVCLQITV